MLVKTTALKMHGEARRSGLEVEKADIVAEAAMSHNLLLNHSGFTPARFTWLHEASVVTAPDAGERAIRLRFLAKEQILKTVVEEGIARAKRTRGEPRQLPDILPGGEVDIWRVPE